MKMESDDLRREITSDMLTQFSQSLNIIPDAIYTIGEYYLVVYLSSFIILN